MLSANIMFIAYRHRDLYLILKDVYINTVLYAIDWNKNTLSRHNVMFLVF